MAAKTYTIPDHVNHRILEHYPGETFTADIPEAQEARLIARGQIKVAGGLSQLSRDELDAVAVQLHIDPSDHPNKPSLIDAIKAADPTKE